MLGTFGDDAVMVPGNGILGDGAVVGPGDGTLGGVGVIEAIVGRDDSNIFCRVLTGIQALDF